MENKTVEVVEEEKENVVSGATQERVQVGQKICPKCGKPFKPSGLAGHLRFVHGFESARATKATLTAKLDKATVFDVVFEVIEKIEKGWETFHVTQVRGPLLIIGVFLMILSALFIVTGLLGELVARTYYESQGKHIYYVRSLHRKDEKA